MSKISIAIFGLLALALPAMAQDTSAISVSAGYSMRLYTQANYSKLEMNGWYGSADYSIFRHFGAEGELSGTYADRGVNGDTSIYSGLIGPRFYPFGHHKLTLYAHVLGGGAYYRVQFPAFGGFPQTVDTDSAFTWEGGAGLEYKRSARWSIRLLEGDYQQTRFFGGHPNQSNYRASIGFVYHLGQK